MIKPWQVWFYSLSLIVAAVVYFGFTVSVLVYVSSGKYLPLFSQNPIVVPATEPRVPLVLAMWTRTNAILMLAMLALRTAAFPPSAGAKVFRLKPAQSAVGYLFWLLALAATIPCLLIYLLVDAPIHELMSPWGTLAAASAVNLSWLAALSIALLLYNAAYIANTRERAFIDQLGWQGLGQRIAVFAGRLAFYLIHSLLGLLFILTWLYDRFKPGAPREEALA